MRLKAKISGHFRLLAVKPGSERLLADFDNLILDQGLEYLGTTSNRDNLTYCQVGDGTGAASVTDTALESLIAATTATSTIKSLGNGSPFHAYWRKTYDFAAGTATGDIAELGVGWAASGSLFSRVRVVDLDGNPTTVSIQADEALKVLYECGYYVLEDDSTGTVDIGGNSHDYIIRPCEVDTVGNPGWYLPSDDGWKMTDINSSWRAYDGDIQIITAAPLGDSESLSSRQTLAAYVPGSLEISTTLLARTYQANLNLGSIRSVVFNLGPACYQCQYDPAIVKNASYEVELPFTLSWGRQ